MPMTFELSARNSIDYDQKLCKYQNSYRLESGRPFDVDPVDKIIKSVIECRLEDYTYDAGTASELCSQTAAEIRKKILFNLNFVRYKIAVIVTIVEKMSQAIETNLGFLCDVDRDDYTLYTLETQTFLVYCIVIGTYFE
ncbi:uncharacterized protein [Chelonus insularis]|uniref:uncharacterized protein isoform X2 n=1 Tax=Chelonus insularis TaxID=460826 RepID=UPI00158C25C2|nr:uncharacterized protein LOC118072798 isoform X2 [Chelonus insularis]